MDIVFRTVLLTETFQIINSAPLILQASTPRVMYLSHIVLKPCPLLPLEGPDLTSLMAKRILMIHQQLAFSCLELGDS